MKLINLKFFTILMLSMVLSSAANAALVSRLGGAAIYDTQSDLTWIADANLARTNQFGLTLSTDSFDRTANTVGSAGLMSWDNTNNWIAGMNNENYLGFSDWRLPTLEPLNGNAFQLTWSYDGSADRGFNISRSGTTYGGSLANEMSFLFYNSLGNEGILDANGDLNEGCASPPCEVDFNTGLFLNFQSNVYWSGLESVINPSDVWSFDFDFGFQDDNFNKDIGLFTLAVRSGDVAAVPVPAAVWLMGSALMGLLGFRRRAVPAQ